MERNNYIGRRIGRYEMLEEIGHGGMAVVYRAMDTVLEREVALKLLHPHLASHTESRKRFLREAKAVARLKHPAVLEIYDYSDAEGEDIFIAMELVRGPSLRRFIDGRRGDKLGSEAAALIMREVATALAHAHDNGIIHRDVKPENILIGPKGQVKLSDFGIAHLAGSSQMTMTGQILGSPAYMSPEHVERSELDERADIFSTGTVIYELVVGRKPFEGNNPHAVIKKIVEGDYDDPIRVNPAAGFSLTRILRKCLAHSPDKRYSTADGLVADLDDTLEAVGVHAGKAELKELFEDSDTWTEKLRPKIIAKTLSMGLAAKKARRHPEAMDHFNRVLALEPGNDKALTSVAGMSRQRQLKRVLERALLAAPILIAICAVVWTFVLREPVDQKVKAIRNSARPAQVVADGGPKEAGGSAGKPDIDTAKTADSKPVSKRPNNVKPWQLKIKRTRDVVFAPKPQAVEIEIDGQERFAYGPKNRQRKLKIGKHVITFIPNDEKSFVKSSWKIDIPPGEKPFHFRETLRWRPSILIIEGNVSAFVTVPGRATGKTNAPFKVAIKNGPSEQISVLVSAEGYIPKTKQVTIQAGEQAKVKISLDKSDN